jgi:hypothetical protein
MKHPGHTSGGPGQGPGGRGTGQGSGGASARAPERAGDGERPHDLLVRELDDLRGELEILAAAEPPADIDERAEAVRERYSELLDDYSDDPEALTRIRALGRRIKDLEEAGSLPRSLIRRGRSRR